MAAPKAILGISPGTRTMGLAVIRNGELIEWQVKTFKGTWSKDKLKHILGAIRKICDYFDVNAITLKKVDPIRSSAQLELLTDHLTAWTKKNTMRVATYSIHDLNAYTGRKQRNLHHAISEHVLEIYPALRQEYMKERNNECEYYSKMFEAVLCAHITHKKTQ